VVHGDVQVTGSNGEAYPPAVRHMY
jgi:hypothetical protein